ncbi:MAG: arsenate reductase (azurin) small subunit [Alteromonadaceae bacterium]|nr:arsenate reductase (azurin) small subunit [Alteromonadaceae bacterium]
MDECNLDKNEHLNNSAPCVSRRNFLLAGASTFVLSTMPGMAHAFKLIVKEHSPLRVASLSQLTEGNPVEFMFPLDNPMSSFTLVKLGERGAGGVGKDQDIVAFSNLCTHMGGPLNGSYKAKHKVLGPCPLHLTTFDLTRHGMVVSGHATQTLPQARLEIMGDDVYITGVMGLIYGQAGLI